MQAEMKLNMAKELRVSTWIDANGKPLDKPLELQDLGKGYKIIYCFQHWCPGCHSHGFPTMKKLHETLQSRGFGFAAIQTVFEGNEKNTLDKLRMNQERYSLKLPFGHDTPMEGKGYPSFMKDYHTRGTPWFTVIDPDNIVVFTDFQLDADTLLARFENE